MSTLEVSATEKPEKKALVAATGHDRATRQLLRVAREASRILETAGYQVLSHYETEATCAAIYVKLLELKQGGMKVATGFIAAHGSKKGLHDRYGKILIDATVCEQLAGSILVLAACLCGGELPKSCTKNGSSVESCIGFRRKLWVPSPKWWSMLLAHSLSKKALEEFRKCVLEPMCSLLRGQSVRDSTREAKRAWREVARMFRLQEMRVALVFEANFLNLDFWGQGSAKL